MGCSTPGFPVLPFEQSLLKLTSIESEMPSNHLILCYPLFLLPPIFPRIRVFFNEAFLHIGWPNYWSFNFSISPSNEYSGLISFRIHWFDLLAVQGTLKSLLQNHTSKASIFQCSAFFMVQLSHPHMASGKTMKWSVSHLVVSDPSCFWTEAHQASLSTEFSRQEYWSGLPFPPPRDLPDSGIKPRSPALQADSLPSDPPGKPTALTIQNFVGKTCLCSLIHCVAFLPRSLDWWTVKFVCI